MVDVHIMSSFVKWEIVTFMGLFISSLAQSIIVAGSFFFSFFFNNFLAHRIVFIFISLPKFGYEN